MRTQKCSPEALERALNEMKAGGQLADEYLARHPEAADIAPLLRAAESAVQAGSPRPRLKPAGVTAGEARLLAHYRARAGRRTARHLLTIGRAVALAAWLVAVVLGAGTAAASGRALPGEGLYPVKRLVETAQLSLASPADRATLQVVFAAGRLEEFLTLAGRGEVNRDSLAATRTAIRAAFDALAYAPAAERATLIGQLVNLTTREQMALNAVKADTSLAFQTDLQHAIERSALDRAQAIDLLSVP